MKSAALADVSTGAAARLDAAAKRVAEPNAVLEAAAESTVQISTDLAELAPLDTRTAALSVPSPDAARAFEDVVDHYAHLFYEADG